MTLQRKNKPTVVGVVRAYLLKAYEENRLYEIKFDEINQAVKEAVPHSKFNPYHLAHYKHKFLLQLNYIRMHKGRVMNKRELEPENGNDNTGS